MRITFYSAVACAALMATEMVSAVPLERREGALAQMVAIDEALVPEFASIIQETAQIGEASDSEFEELAQGQVLDSNERACESDGLVLGQLRDRCHPSYAQLDVSLDCARSDSLRTSSAGSSSVSISSFSSSTSSRRVDSQEAKTVSTDSALSSYKSSKNKESSDASSVQTPRPPPPPKKKTIDWANLDKMDWSQLGF